MRKGVVAVFFLDNRYVTSANEVHCVDFQCLLPYGSALCRYETTFVGVVSQLTTPMQSAYLS